MKAGSRILIINCSFLDLIKSAPGSWLERHAFAHIKGKRERL